MELLCLLLVTYGNCSRGCISIYANYIAWIMHQYLFVDYGMRCNNSIALDTYNSDCLVIALDRAVFLLYLKLLDVLSNSRFHIRGHASVN